MGKIFLRVAADRASDVYQCRECNSDIGTEDAVVSKAFHGQGGKAYLISNIINVYTGELLYYLSV